MRKMLNVMGVYYHDQMERSRISSRDFGLAVGVLFIKKSTYQTHSCYGPPIKGPKALSYTRDISTVKPTSATCYAMECHLILFIFLFHAPLTLNPSIFPAPTFQ